MDTDSLKDELKEKEEALRILAQAVVWKSVDKEQNNESLDIIR